MDAGLPAAAPARAAALALPLVLVLLLAGCSARQMYAAGQGWQRNECTRMPDGAERDRCLANAERSYDDYQRSRGAVTAPR
jgi:hypothetical protein